MKSLIIAYYFPPVGGGGVTRALKFVKYLANYNWEPIVLTALGNPCGYGTYDESLLKDIPPKMEIDFAFSYDPISIFQYLSKKQISFDSSGHSYGHNNKFHSYVIKHIFKPVYSLIDNLLLIPDARILWVLPAYFKARKLIRQKQIDVVFITGPPHSTHLIGYLIKKTINIPVLIDFRDAWTSNPSLKPKYKLRQFIEERFERGVLANVDKIICTTKPIQNALMTAHPKISSLKFKVITNGFDIDDYQDIDLQSNTKFTICHTGVLRNKKTPDYFIKAISELLGEHPELKNKITINFVGNFPLESQQLIDDFGLENIINVAGYLPHGECIRYQLESDVLLLLLFEEEDGSSVYPGKMFEYIAAKKPILAAVPDGISSDLIISEKLGIVVPPKDIQQIKKSIYSLYCQHETDSISLNKTNHERFDRRELTRDLASTFEELVKNVKN